MRYVRVEFEGQLRDARLDHLGDDGELRVTLLRAPALHGGTVVGTSHTLRTEALRAPLSPGKIVCVGQNYRKHAAELGKPVPDEPLLFLKATSSIVGPGGAIRCPPESELVHHEGELGVVIGTRMVDVPESEALRHVFGYVATNDVTARDIQKREIQHTRAKSYDTFACCGPFMVRGLDFSDLQVTCRLNGEQKQVGRTSDMVHSPAKLVAFISNVMTLLPGDLISTGTPSGVGPMKDGDVVEVEIEGIGVLRNPVKR